MSKQIFQSGIDVSRYQGTIDWSQVARSGKQFVIARAVSSDETGVYVDPTFEQNFAGARNAGLRVGAYYFTYAQTTAYADREIAAVLGALRGKQLQYPVFIDVESDSLTGLGRVRLTELVLYALKKLSAAGYHAGVYTYAYFAETYLDMALLAGWPFWLSDYVVPPAYQGRYDMLQYSSTGRVEGISTNVDLDVSYTDFYPHITQNGKNNYPNGSTPVPMVPTPNLCLTVYGTKNCQYFFTANVNDIAGTLPPGTYETVAQSEGCYAGFSWVTIRYKGGVYWTALLADRCYLVRC